MEESQSKPFKQPENAEFSGRNETEKKMQQTFVHRSFTTFYGLPRKVASSFNTSSHMNLVVMLVLFVVSLQFTAAETKVYSSAADLTWHIPLDKRKINDRN